MKSCLKANWKKFYHNRLIQLVEYKAQNIDHSPLVSAIVAFYNEEKFLTECIESVMHQTFTDWELILVDDGSSDASTAIALDYGSRYPGKIIYSEHAGHFNKGLSASRNRGISIAKGELLAFLDADDFWLPGKLKAQVDIFNRFREVAMVCDASIYWRSWNNCQVEDEVLQVAQEQDKIYQPGELFEAVYPFSIGHAPCPSGIMVIKDVATKHGCFEAHFDGKRQLFEDQAFLSKVYLEEHVYISSNATNKYRLRKGSLVQSITSDGHYEEVKRYFVEWFFNYVQQNTFATNKVKLIVERAFKRYQPVFRPLITIVLFLNRHSGHLAQSIKSLKSQTYLNWECIVIDVNATEKERSVAYEFKNESPNKIQIIDQNPAFNRYSYALEMIKGEYVAFLGKGFLWAPQKLSDQLEWIKTNPGAGIYCENFTHKSGKIINVDVVPGICYQPPQLFSILQPFGSGCRPILSSALIDVSWCRSLDMFDESTGSDPVAQENAFWTKVFLSMPVVVAPSANTISMLPFATTRTQRISRALLDTTLRKVSKLKSTHPDVEVFFLAHLREYKHSFWYKVTVRFYKNFLRTLK